MKHKVEISSLSASEDALTIRTMRYFSESFKRDKVSDLVAKRVSIQQLCDQYGVSRASVYKWLYRYSPHHSQKTKQVVEMESEATKTAYYQNRVAELERIIGQKQLEIDFQNKAFDLASAELGFDIKKKYSTVSSNGFAPILKSGLDKDIG